MKSEFIPVEIPGNTSKKEKSEIMNKELRKQIGTRRIRTITRIDSPAGWNIVYD